jgi:hypothetical protein
VTSDPVGILRDYSNSQLQFAIEYGPLEVSGSADEILNHTYGYVGQNPLSWYDPFGLAKGGKKNIGTEGFTKNSDPKDVEEALKDAMKKKQSKRIKALRALLKVIKRGGTMTMCPPIIDDVVSNVLKENCLNRDPNSCGALKQMFPEVYDKLFEI